MRRERRLLFWRNSIFRRNVIARQNSFEMRRRSRSLLQKVRKNTVPLQFPRDRARERGDIFSHIKSGIAVVSNLKGPCMQ